MTRSWSSFLAAGIFLLSPLPAQSAQLEIVLLPKFLASADAPAELSLSLRNNEPDRQPLRRGLRVTPAPQLVQVAEGTWTLEAQAQGLWAPSKTILLEKEGKQRVEIELYRASSVHAQIQVEKGEALPQEVGLELYPPVDLPGPSNPRPARPHSSGTLAFRCPVLEGSFTCPAPAGEWDLRVRAADHISHYFWKHPFPQNSSASLGTLRMRRGSSVVGWVRAEGTIPRGRQIEVTLTPLSAASSSSKESIDRALGMRSTANDRGFFHLTGVPSGAYALSATLAGFATAKFFPLRVVEDRESQLQEPLVLGPPVRLEVNVFPPTDLHQKPWDLQIFDLGETPGAMEQIAEAKTAPGGTWQGSDLPAGRLLVQLADSTGTLWSYREVEVSGGDSQIDFDLDIVEVDGTLRLGEEPLAGAIFFGGRMAVPSFRFESDLEGRFHGFIAREGLWPIEIEAQDPPVHRFLARVDVHRAPGKRVANVALALPAGRLQGRVTNEQDQPVPGARVRLQSAEDRAVTAKTDEDGEFELHGLGTSDLWLQASGQGEESEALWFHFDEDTDRPVHLILKKKRELTGWVLGPGGGVSGAQVLATAPGEVQARAVTDVAGNFRLKVPATAASLELVVLPPGHTLEARRVRIDPGEDLRLLLGAQGGTLVLKGLDSAHLGPLSGSALLVTQNGVPVSLSTLRSWAEANGTRWMPGPPPRAPQLAAGRYEVCRVPYPLLSAWVQGNRSAGNCAAGWLPAGGELALEIPPEETASSK